MYKSSHLCTFDEEYECVDTINLRNYLKESKEIYNEYINKTINCYHGDYILYGIFIENEILLSGLIMSSIFIFIIILVCFCNNNEYVCCNLRNQNIEHGRLGNIEVRIIENPIFETVIDIPLTNL